MDELKEINSIINSHPKPVIRITAFKERYLPLLFDKDPSLFNTRWINEVAMSPYLSVTIVDDNNKILHIVPPLRKSVASTTDQSIGIVATKAVLESGRHQMIGNNFLETYLPKVLGFKNSRSIEIQEQWNQFIIDLGYGDMIIKNEDSRVNNKIDNDDIEIMDNKEW